MSKRKAKKQEARNRKSEFWKGVMYALLGVVLFFQIMTLIALVFGTSIVDFSPPQRIREATWIVPVLITMVILLSAAVVLCKAWKRKETLSLVPAVLSTGGTVLALIIALTFRAGYDDVVNATGDIALTDWEWFWRHCTPIIVGAVTATISFMHHRGLRKERIRKENEAYLETFNFDEDDPLAEEPKKEKKKSKKERLAEKE